jgi:hypothetical protein
LQHLADALSLSGSQQTAIAPIVESAVQQIEQIHQQAKSQTVDVINSASGQITPLLTPDQQAKFAKIVQDLEAHGGPGMAHHAKFAGHGGPGNQLGMLTQKLGLSPDQQNQVKPILDAAHAQVKAIFTNTSLTREQKLAQVKETMQGAFGQINGLLTPEQQTQFAAMKEKMHNHLHHQGPPASAPSVSGTTTSPI